MKTVIRFHRKYSILMMCIGFKGSIMIVCVLLPRRAGRSRGRNPSDRPAARQHPREFDTNNTHTIMFDPDYNMMPHFFSTATNILLIKSNLKFESRATAVSVAMSPRYLDGKYRSRLHHRSQKCSCQFLRETARVQSNCARPASSASRGDNEVDHAVCLKLNFRYTLSFPMKMASSTQLWCILSVLQQVGMFFDVVGMSFACLMQVWPLFKREFPRVPMTCANFKCDVAGVNK